jgi:hypothetical protein
MNLRNRSHVWDNETPGPKIPWREAAERKRNRGVDRGGAAGRSRPLSEGENVIAARDSWVATGAEPTAAALGFIPGVVGPAWPQQ